MTTTSVAVPGRSVSQMTADLLESGDPVAENIYWTGHRAGASAERARIQLAAADFGADLGPSPALRPRLRAVPDQGSPEAGQAVKDAAIAAWRALYATGQIRQEVAA
ncbi:hypothetical protein [Kocuria soli]|uniref:hypothetical protein n=1 Tax=Kocuria soli TaxID=2485125 RepID=UPI000F4F0338|nr:hypothetical protein [Kocuria soli]